MPSFVETVTDRCARFQDYWSGLPKSEPIPHTRDFLRAPEPELIPNVYILELSDDGPLIRFMGTALVALRGRDLTGKLFTDGLPDSFRKVLVHNCAMVAQQPCGLLELAEFKSSTGRPFRMESIMLPLAVDKGRMPRVCSFSALLEELSHEDRDDPRFNGRKQSDWFDIGAGCPASRPIYSGPDAMG